MMRKADNKDDAMGRCCAMEELKDADKIYLRIHCDFRDMKDIADFYYSIDNVNWVQIGEQLQMNYDMPDFMGYRYGLFAYAKEETEGFVDFDWFHIDVDSGTGV